jgi:hypothetical protein
LYFNQQRMKIPVAPAIEMPAFWILTIWMDLYLCLIIVLMCNSFITGDIEYLFIGLFDTCLFYLVRYVPIFYLIGFFLFSFCGYCGLCLVDKQTLYHLSYVPTLLALVIFQTGSHAFCWGQPETMILLMSPSWISGTTGVSHHTWQVVNFLICFVWD